MTDPKFYWDQDRLARAKLPSSQDLVASFLEEDIQLVLPRCDEFLRLCEEARADPGYQCSRVGNAHKVTIRANAVVIENLYLDDLAPCTLSIDQFRDLVAAWRDFIATRPP